MKTYSAKIKWDSDQQYLDLMEWCKTHIGRGYFISLKGDRHRYLKTCKWVWHIDNDAVAEFYFKSKEDLTQFKLAWL